MHGGCEYEGVWRDGAVESLPNFASLFVTGFAVFVSVVVAGTVWLILRGRRRPESGGGV